MNAERDTLPPQLTGRSIVRATLIFGALGPLIGALTILVMLAVQMNDASIGERLLMILGMLPNPFVLIVAYGVGLPAALVTGIAAGLLRKRRVPLWLYMAGAAVCGMVVVVAIHAPFTSVYDQALPALAASCVAGLGCAYLTRPRDPEPKAESERQTESETAP